MNGSDFIIRQKPYAFEAEQALLGSIIKSPDMYEEIVDIIKEEDFFVERHKIIFNAITELYLKSKALDLITLLNLIDSASADEDNKVYLTNLAQFVPYTSNIRDYAEIVKEKSLRRQLINISEEISKLSYEDSSDMAVILDRAQQMLYSLLQNHDSSNFTHVKYILVSVFDQLHRIANEPDKSKGIASGFSSVDNLMIGMNSGDLILIGARPGMGKTAFAMNVAMNVAVKKKTIAVFSLEMSKEQIVLRMLASEAKVDSMRLRSGNLPDADWSSIVESGARISECDIYFDDTPNINVTSMKTKLRKLRHIDLVIIDYLQLMQSEHSVGNRVQEVSEISRNLKIMAKELGIPVITCAQLSRGPESRGENKRPMLSDLRDSGAIEQDADVVMFLYREEYYKESVDNHNKAEIIFAKNRHGSTGKVEVGWIGNLFKFYDIDNIHQE